MSPKYELTDINISNVTLIMAVSAFIWKVYIIAILLLFKEENR